MRVQFSESFVRDYARLPKEIKDRADKQVRILADNLSHPGLRTKKMRGPANVWEARVTRGYRLTFEIAGDLVVLRRVGTHDTLSNP